MSPSVQYHWSQVSWDKKGGDTQMCVWLTQARQRREGDLSWETQGPEQEWKFSRLQQPSTTFTQSWRGPWTEWEEKKRRGWGQKKVLEEAAWQVTPFINSTPTRCHSGATRTPLTNQGRRQSLRFSSLWSHRGSTIIIDSLKTNKATRTKI